MGIHFTVCTQVFYIFFLPFSMLSLWLPKGILSNGATDAASGFTLEQVLD